MKISAAKCSIGLCVIIGVAAAIYFPAHGAEPTGEPAAESKPIVVKAIAFSDQGGGKVNVRSAQQASPAYVHEWCTTGHWLEWTVDAPAAGEYELSLHYGAKFDTARQLRANGKAVADLDALKLPATGNFASMKDFKAPLPVTLAHGNNVLRLTCLDDQSVWLAGITLARGGKNIAVDPARFSGQGGGRVQCIISDGAGFFSIWDTKGHALEWTIAGARAGDYSLTLGCATQDVPTRELKINGEIAAGLEVFGVASTGSWRNWCEYTLPSKVTLRDGRNVLRMTNIEGSLNLTTLRLSAAGKPDILVRAIDFSAEEGGKVQVHPALRQYIDNWSKAGQWLEWKFDASAAGEYQVVLRYTPADMQRGEREFKINGAVVKGLESYEVPGASVRDYREVELPANVTLRAGQNVLRITNLENQPLILHQVAFIPMKAK